MACSAALRASFATAKCPQRGSSERRVACAAAHLDRRARGASPRTFVTPIDGAQVGSPFTVQMEVAGLELKPASEGLISGSGHHHIIVDGPAPTAGSEIPFDATHLHFGKAQTEFADAKHTSYGPQFAKTITINVAP
eukprot:jgi/Tetstr1/439918/TSEL_028325.t1